MDDRVLQFRVGVMIVASVSIAAILVIIFNFSPSLVRGQYTVHIKFPQAPGVMQDTPVRKSGVLIGRVTKVELLEPTGVQVSARIDKKFPLSEHEVCRIGTESLLGNAVLEFVPSDDPSAKTTPIEDGAFMTGDVAGDPLKVLTSSMETFAGSMQTLTDLEDDVRNAMVAFRDTSGEVQGLAKNINTMVDANDEKFARVLDKSEQALDEVTKAMQSINSVVGNPERKAELEAAIDKVPKLVQDSLDAVAEFHDVARQAKRNLDNMESVANGVLTETEDIFDKVENAVTQFETASGEFEEFSRRLNNPDGTIGQLAANPELYQRLNRAADNVEQLTQRLRPVVEDARVFSDKIARDPGRLGLKGVIDRGGTGTKFLPLSYLQPASGPMFVEPWHGGPPPAAQPPAYFHPHGRPHPQGHAPAAAGRPTNTGLQSPQQYWLRQ